MAARRVASFLARLAPPRLAGPSQSRFLARGDLYFLPASIAFAPPLFTLKVLSGWDARVAGHCCLHRDAASREAVRRESGDARGPPRPVLGLPGSEVAGRPFPQVRGPGKGQAGGSCRASLAADPTGAGRPATAAPLDGARGSRYPALSS